MNQNKIEGLVPPPEGGLPPKGGKLRAGGGKKQIVKNVLILERILGVLQFFWLYRENGFKIKSLQSLNLIVVEHLKISPYSFHVQKYFTLFINPCLTSKMVKIKNVLAILYDFENYSHHKGGMRCTIETRMGFWAQKRMSASLDWLQAFSPHLITSVTFYHHFIRIVI